MRCSLRIKRSAAKALAAIPKADRLRVVEAIDLLCDTPAAGSARRGVHPYARCLTPTCWQQGQIIPVLRHERVRRGERAWIINRSQTQLAGAGSPTWLNWRPNCHGGWLPPEPPAATKPPHHQASSGISALTRETSTACA